MPRKQKTATKDNAEQAAYLPDSAETRPSQQMTGRESTEPEAKKEETKTAFMKADKAYVRAKNVTLAKEKEPPRRTVFEEPLLTSEHRAELRGLVTDWVSTSNLAKKPMHYGTAYARLYEDHFGGAVNGIEQIYESEFEGCRAFIKQRIMILEGLDKGGLTRKKGDWHDRRIKTIQSACRANGIPEEKRRAYLEARFGVDSLLLLTDDQLEECRAYAVGKNPPPTWNPPERDMPGLQELREKALSKLVKEFEKDAEGRGEYFDRMAMRITGGKGKILELLFSRDGTLFEDKAGKPISEDRFKKFWEKQQVCKFAKGRRGGS